MKDTLEVQESPEKQITKTPEKKIETFDDLKTSDKTQEINSFDDISMREGSERSIQTFDDISRSKEGTTNQEISDSSENRTIVNDSPDAIEQNRMNQAAEGIKKIDWMKPGKWETLSNDEKRIALEHSGRALGDAYHNPEPPLSTEKAIPNELGEYGDGYYSDPNEPSNPEKFVGSDYGIRMNEEGLDYEKNKELFGDDPKIALDTYSHEFRHSYQNEQAHAFDKGFGTDNPDKAREWSENLKDYKQPPDAELAKTDPETYFKEYEAYRNQPAEKDAREFSAKIITEVYDQDHVLKDK